MDHDVIVLGGGTAGSAAAAAAHAAGARTVLINDGELGGLCILRGCMPTKTLLHSAHVAHEARHAARFGVTVAGDVSVSFDAAWRRKDELVARFQRAKVSAVESAGHEIVFGRARFHPEGGVELEDGRRLAARRMVIATGSRPSVPSLPGLDGVPWLSSDDVMRLDRQPRSLLVVGAGAIGLELAQLFARLGTSTTVLARRTLLPDLDPECGEELARALAAEANLEVLTRTRITQLRGDGQRVAASLDVDGRPGERSAEALLLAAGRTASLEDLGLEHVGLAAERGRLAHDDTMRTAHPDIFVAGDATGSFQVLHEANAEGAVAGHNAAGASPERRVDRRLKMQVVFTDPPYAQVGLTAPEVDAERSGGRRVLEGRARFPETGRAITMGAEHGLWKLWADAETQEILGSSVLGPRADDLVHLAALVMHFRGRLPDLAGMPWYHPTLAEVFLNLERDLAAQGEGAEPCPSAPA